MSQSDVFKMMDVGTQWPDCGFVELALLDLAPQRIQASLSTDLVEGIEEGLGTWRAIGVQMESGAMVELISHDASPVAGFFVRCDALHALGKTLEDVLGILRVGHEVVTWTNPLLCSSASK